MGRGQFTEAELEELKRNPYVHDVNRTCISYSREFKQRFIEEYQNGRRPVQIFRDAGFDPVVLGSKRIERACARWKKAYKKGTLDRKEAVLQQFDGTETEEMHAGGEQKELSETEALRRLCREQERNIWMLQVEAEFLRRLCRKGNQLDPGALSARMACGIISEIAQEEQYAGCVSHLCETAGISRALYYHYKHRRERLG